MKWKRTKWVSDKQKQFTLTVHKKVYSSAMTSFKTKILFKNQHKSNNVPKSEFIMIYCFINYRVMMKNKKTQEEY